MGQNFIDKALLENTIIHVLLKTYKNRDRAYLDTIKRILEGNSNSKIANKYKNDTFYRRFPGIYRWFLAETLNKMIAQNKILAHPGNNDYLYYTVNPKYIPTFEIKEEGALEELLLKEITNKLSGKDNK